MKTFCQLVKERRIELGYSAALTAKIAGLYPSNYYVYESGGQRPGKDTIRKIAQALEMDENMLTAYSALDNGEFPESFLRDGDFMRGMYDKLEEEWK